MTYAQQITTKKLRGGGRLFAAKFPAGGSISVVGSIAGGARMAGSSELAHTHAAMLLEGTRSHAKKDLQILLDTIGASLTFYANDSRLAWSGRVPAKHASAFLAIVSEVLREPVFPEEALAIYKQRAEASLTLESQDTNRQANIALSRLLYPEQHPNFAESTSEARTALDAITSETLTEFHSRIVSRDSLIISVAGDMDSQKLFALCETHFGSLPEIHVSLPNFHAAQRSRRKHTAVPIPEKASIDYVTGVTAGITNTHSDYPALMLGLQILGSPSGFSGRLMKTVREEEGLTYGVYAYMNSFSNTVDGYISVWGTFAPQLFAQGSAAIKRELRRIVTDGVTEEETRRHAEMYYARSRVRLSTSSAFARAAHDTAVQDKPLTYLDTFPRLVRKLTAQEVNAALKAYIVLDDFSEAAAGPLDPTMLQ